MREGKGVQTDSHTNTDGTRKDTSHIFSLFFLSLVTPIACRIHLSHSHSLLLSKPSLAPKVTSTQFLSCVLFTGISQKDRDACSHATHWNSVAECGLRSIHSATHLHPQTLSLSRRKKTACSAFTLSFFPYSFFYLTHNMRTVRDASRVLDFKCFIHMPAHFHLFLLTGW